MRVKDVIFSDVYKKPSAFGLDISDFSIKIAQLEKRDNGFKLKSFNRTAVPEGIIEEGEIKKEKELVNMLRKAIGEAKGERIRTPYAVCSLPEQHGFIKIIQLPKMKLGEAREAIKWEAEANIPLSLEEVYLDWKIISLKEEKHLNVLINAVPKVLVNKYLEVLRAADIEPIVFEIESVATARSLIKDGLSPQPVLLVDLGFARTSFIIFLGSTLCFTSSSPFSNQSMISGLAEKLKISKEQAQKLKFKIELNKKSKKREIFNALAPDLAELVNQIEKYLTFHKEHIHKIDHQSDISKIILCGGGAYLEGLPQYLSTQLNIPVVLGDAWTNISSKADKKFKDSLAYSTALGLALRGAQLDNL